MKRLPVGGYIHPLVAITLLAVATVAPRYSNPASQPSPRVVVPAESKAPPAWPRDLDEIRFGLSSYSDIAVTTEAYERLADYLSARIGVPVSVYVASSYGDLRDRLIEGDIDIAKLPPITYVEAHDRYPNLRILAAQVSEGSTSYLGYLLVRQSSAMYGLEDLAGRSICYTDPHSSSGYHYPRALLREKGFDPDQFFSRTTFAGDHIGCLRQVLAGDVDAAALFSGAIATARRRGLPLHQLRVVAQTKRIPNDPYCARPNLPRAAADRIAWELLALSTRSVDGRAVLAGPIRMNAWRMADDSDYDGVREALAASRGRKTR